MKKNLLQALKIVFFFSLGAGILLYVYFSFNTKYCDNQKTAYDSYALLNKIVADFGRLNWWWMGALLLAYLMSNLSRALRWNLLIEPLGVKARTVNTFFATIIGYLVNLAFPRAGEIAKPAVVARYEKLPLDRLIGTIVVDRIVDLSIFASLIGLSFLMEFDRINTFIQAGKAASSSTPADGAQPAASGPPSSALRGFAGGRGDASLAGDPRSRHKVLWQRTIVVDGASGLEHRYHGDPTGHSGNPAGHEQPSAPTRPGSRVRR